MKNKKESYVKALILLDDISNYHSSLNSQNIWNKKLRLLKNSFIPLKILGESFSEFNFIQKNDKQLISLARKLKKRIQFTNHVRNKISGHIDIRILKKAIQWEPYIFNSEIKNNKKAQLSFAYKGLLESAINSHIDINSKQKTFNKEIDLTYPPDKASFLNYLGELNIDSISYLKLIINLLKTQIKFWEPPEMMKMAKNAGETTFNIKNNCT